LSSLAGQYSSRTKWVTEEKILDEKVGLDAVIAPKKSPLRYLNEPFGEIGGYDKSVKLFSAIVNE